MSNNGPKFFPPLGACDCHAHVFDGKSKLAADRLYTPDEASLADYRSMLLRLGISRGVIVQPSVYGLDNCATLAASASDPEKFRAIVVLDHDCDDAEITRCHAMGARGVRLNAVFGGSADRLQSWARRLAPHNWHIQLLVDVSRSIDLADIASRISVPLVFDHMGHLPASKTINDPGFQSLLRAVGAGHAWVKLSGAYRLTGRRHLPYDDVEPFAKSLIAANPENCIWASDWPHPSISTEMPDDLDLLNVFAAWAPDKNVQHRILVDNPARLYDFPQSIGD